MIFSLNDFISSIDDIATVRHVIAERRGVKDEEIYLFGFSLMGSPVPVTPVYNEEEDPESQVDYEKTVYNNSSEKYSMSSKISFNVNRIVYTLDGVRKFYDSYQDVDLCTDFASRNHLAESIIMEQEGLTDADTFDLKILSVTNITDEAIGKRNADNLFGDDDNDDDSEMTT